MYSLDGIHERQHQVPQRLLNITPSRVCRGLKSLLMSSQLDTPFFLSPEPWLSTCSFQQAILFSPGQQHPKPPEKTAHLSMLRIFGQSGTTLLNSISFCTDRQSIVFSHQFFLCTSTGCIKFSFKNKNFLASSSDFSLGSAVLWLSTTKSSFFWLYIAVTQQSGFLSFPHIQGRSQPCPSMHFFMSEKYTLWFPTFLSCPSFEQSDFYSLWRSNFIQNLIL